MTDRDLFISTIGPIIQKEAYERGYKVCSPIIAQACCESNFGKSSLGYKYFNYFGMKCGSKWKGKSVNLSTREEYTVGQLTNIKANFRAYDNMEEGVKGYFEFISSSRYSKLKTSKTPEEYLNNIKSAGYATSSTYVSTNLNIVTMYNLTKYDSFKNVEENNTLYYKRYTGTSNSIIDALTFIGEDSKFSTRKKIANANGITLYIGSSNQNLELVKLIKNGLLKRFN